METHSNDRQVLRTQMMLITALLELLEASTYDQLTIQQVCERANIGRSTFYAHFQSKDDLLRFGFNHALDVLVKELTIQSDTREVRWNALPFLQHVRRHFNLYRTLLLGSGYAELTNQGVIDLAGKIAQKVKSPCIVPMEILAYSIASTTLSLVKYWLDHRMSEDIEKIDSYFQSLIVVSLQNQLIGS